MLKPTITKHMHSSFHSVVLCQLATVNLIKLPSTHQSRKAAFKNLFKSHLQGFIPATSILGFCFEFGLAGLSVNYAIAAKMYQIAASKSDGLAQLRLSFWRTHGRPNVQINLLEALHWKKRCNLMGASSRAWLESVVIEIPEASFCLALCYYNGISVQKNDETAFQLCKAAAEKGVPSAQNVLGNFYLEGSGCVGNPSTALKWYIKAARAKNPAAIYNIGTMFERGLAVELNPFQAFEWYQRAATYGSVNALNVLGIFLEQGVGTVASPHRAVEKYTQAALQGHPHAQYNLARCYHDGFGGAKNDYVAFSWFQQSAAQGHEMAQLSAAICYEFGIGVERNMGMAEKNYMLCFKNGNARAHARLIPIVGQRVLAASRAILSGHHKELQTTGDIPNRWTGMHSLPTELKYHILDMLNEGSVLTQERMEFIISSSTNQMEDPAASNILPDPRSLRALSAKNKEFERKYTEDWESEASNSLDELLIGFDKSMEAICDCNTPRSSCQEIKHVTYALGLLGILD